MNPENNWSMVVTEAGDKTKDFPRADPLLHSRLAVLTQKWENRNPDTAVSVVTGDGTHIFMGRYYEGVVVRINEDDDHVTFLTTEMAKQFGEWLVGQKSHKG